MKSDPVTRLVSCPVCGHQTADEIAMYYHHKRCEAGELRRRIADAVKRNRPYHEIKLLLRALHAAEYTGD